MPATGLATRLAAVVVLVLSGMLTSCRDAAPQLFGSDNYPGQLSAWQLLRVEDGQLAVNDEALPYQLATPLFSDYALKLRTVWLPDGTTANYREDQAFDFPVGTVISKTFYYPIDGAAAGLNDEQVPRLRKTTANPAEMTRQLDLDRYRLIETRLLVHQASGWEALPYVWNDAQTDATLQITGDIQRLRLEDTAFVYVVPNRNECAGCHVLDQNKGDLSPIGPAARHLNRLISSTDGEQQQLSLWQQRGWLPLSPAPEQMPANAMWDESIKPGETQATVSARVRAYLDINCGHCHQPGGSGDTSGLFLHAAETSAMRLGVCKPPVAAGRGAGGHRFSIVPGQPESSILSYRIESQETGVLMPELGRSLVHDEGLALINAWISSQSGDCL